MRNNTPRKANLKEIVCLGASLLLPAFPAFGNSTKHENPNNPQTQSVLLNEQKSQPEILATFEYQSNRPEEEYKGKTLQYNILSNGKFVQADKPDVEFSTKWFYDIDGDGEFGDAEKNAIKTGKLIYMHPEFNQKANQEVRNVLSYLFNQNKELQGELEKMTQTLIKPDVPTREFEQELRDYRESQKSVAEPILDFEPREEREVDKKVPPLSLIVGANYSADQNSVGQNIGLRFGYNENLINAALLFGYQKGLLENTSTVTSPTSPAGLSGRGILKEKDFQSFGIDGQIYLGNKDGRFILGGGYHNQTYIEDKTAQILMGDHVLNSNNISEKKSNHVVRGYFGADFNVADTIRPELIFGLEGKLKSGKATPYFGLRTTIAPPSKYGKR